MGTKRGAVGTVRRRARVVIALGALTALVALLGGCSGGSDSGDAAGSDEATSCQESAALVVQEFDAFVIDQGDVEIDEFLTDPDVAGLEAFQNRVAEIVVGVATDPNDECTEFQLEQQVDEALADYAAGSALAQYLVGSVRQGVTVEQRDIRVTPDDDLLALLPALGPGSSVEFSAGTFQLDVTLLIQNELTIVGAGRTETVIESTADTAAIAVVGPGRLVANDLTIRHVGELPASVLLSVDAGLELVGVGIEGGVVDADGGGGSGLVLTSAGDPDSGAVEPVGDDEGASDQSAADQGSTDQGSSDEGAAPEVVGDDLRIRDNGAAGIAVTSAFAPSIVNSEIDANAQCGVCYFDRSAGQLQDTLLRGNGVGVQSSDESRPEISRNDFRDNQVAGLLIEDDSSARVIENTFAGEDIVGVDVQGQAAPVLQRNEFEAHAVSISFRGDATGSASSNRIAGGDVAVLVGGTATPSMFENEITDTETASILNTGESGGDFVENVLRPASGAGIVVEGSATPIHRAVVIEGGVAGVVFREQSGGRLGDSILRDQEVSVEAGDNSTPMIEGNEFAGATAAAIIVSSDGAVSVRANRVVDPVAIGIQSGGTGEITIRDNTVSGGDTALLVTDSSAPVVTENVFTGQNFGVGISGDAAPEITDNEIVAAAAGAVSFEGTSAGLLQNNRIREVGVVGIRVAGQAAPRIDANQLFAVSPEPVGVLSDDADGSEPPDSERSAQETAADAAAEPTASSGAGILYVDDAAGEARDNQLFGFVIGIQVGDDAAPALVENRVDGVGIGGVGILYGGDGAGRAEANTIVDQQLGLQLSERTGPELVDNVIEGASAAALLIQGNASPTVSGTDCPDSAAGIVVLEAATPDLADNTCPTTS